MNTITSKEIDSFCDKTFCVQGGTFDDKNLKKIKFDSIRFKKDGSIYSFNNKVGTWKKDRTIYLSNYKRKFFFNNISNNTLRINSRYSSKKDTLTKQIRIILVNKEFKKDSVATFIDF